MPKKPSSKIAIATLFSSLSYFQPERDKGVWTGRFIPTEKALVNQSKDPIPERDDLLKRIGEASMEMTNFLRDHDIIKTQVESFTSDGMLISQMIDGAIGKMPSDMPALERLDILVTRYRQLYSVIHKIANDIPSEDAKAHAKRFLVWKGDSLKPLALVNQNEKEATESDARSGESFCTCKKPDPYENDGIIYFSASCPIHGTSGSNQPVPSNQESKG